MQKLIHTILTLPEFSKKPPVLVDIGASYEIHKKWRVIAPYAICIAFDADTRDFSVREEEHSGFKKLFLVNRIVADMPSASMPFWLTKSPHCSSALMPNNAALRKWAFAPLFEFKKKVSMEATTLGQVLLNSDLDHIDWYKSDSQGTDLRIFTSLDESVRDKTLVAEFEPGILDAYVGEDKLSSLMCFMENRPFWVEDMFIKGSQRIDENAFNRLNAIQRKFICSFLRTSPGWCEIRYMNTFDSLTNKRDYLLGWVFSIVLKEYGFALELAIKGKKLFGDHIFDEMKSGALRQLQKGYLHLGWYISTRVIRKFFGK